MGLVSSFKLRLNEEPTQPRFIDTEPYGVILHAKKKQVVRGPTADLVNQVPFIEAVFEEARATAYALMV